MSKKENEQLFTIAIMYCNIWLSVQTAHNEGQLDETLFRGCCKDPSIEIGRFPNLKGPIKRWLVMFPEMADQEIFRAVIAEIGSP